MFFFVPKSTTMKSLLTTSTLPLISPLLTLPKSKPPLFTPSFHQQPLNTPFLHLVNSSFLFCRDSVRFCSSVSDDELRLQRQKGKGQGCWGEIHVIVGPMFAGKTTTLLRRVQSEVANGRSVAIIKSNKDTRYGLDSIVTHDGDKYPCLPLKDLSSFRQMFGARAYDELDVIGIDEAQFFDDLYDFCQKAADQDGKTVIVAGLDGDYLRRSFGSVLDIIPLADSVTKLTARCEMCGKLAHFTLRKTDETKTELIGGADKYMPVCRQHYISGQVVIEATRTILQEKVQLA